MKQLEFKGNSIELFGMKIGSNETETKTLAISMNEWMSKWRKSNQYIEIKKQNHKMNQKDH